MTVQIETLTRALELRIVDESQGGRTLTGVVVPYDEVSMVTPYPQGEKFLRGAFKRSAGRLKGGKVVKLFRAHDHTRAIGLAARLWEEPEGLLGEFRFGTTPAADEALLEVREGLLDAFSVGFRTVVDRYSKDGVREVVEADILEASLAPLPSYEGAKVLALRQQTRATIELPPMPVVNLEPLPRV